MLKKKLLYFVIITGLLLGPIVYWLNSLWGIKINNLLSFGMLRYILSQDKFLLVVTSVNSTLYLIAVIKIFTMKEKDDVNEVIQNKQDPNMPSFLNNPSQTDIKKWESLYSNNQSVTLTIEPELSQKTNTEENVEKQNEKVITQPKDDIPEQTTHVSIKTVQNLENNSNDNVVNMPDTVTAIDVYRNMINDVLVDTGYTNIGPQIIGNTDVDFVSIAESDTLVIGIITTETGDIIANEISNSGTDAPSWFTNEHKFTSPVWEIKNVSNMIQNMINEVLPEDNGIIIKPIVVVPGATVSNFADIKAKWEEIGVSVVRFMNHSDLPNLADVLPDRKGTEVLESYKNFVNTLMKYFNQKARKKPVKKVG